MAVVPGVTSGQIGCDELAITSCCLPFLGLLISKHLTRDSVPGLT
jgi:hypothetical protein